MWLPSWLTWYKKPEYRDIREYADNINNGKRSMSPVGRGSSIPGRLRLDRILENKTCMPGFPQWSPDLSLTWSTRRQPHVAL